MEENKFWRSRVELITAHLIMDLIPKINEFCKDKFVVGIQYPDSFQEKEYSAIVSYKVKEC